MCSTKYGTQSDRAIQTHHVRQIKFLLQKSFFCGRKASNYCAMTTVNATDTASQLRIIRITGHSDPLPLASGQMLEKVDIAYETWGELSAKKDNVVVVCHALTGDQFAAGPNPVTGRPAWWPRMIGPGKPVDTDRFFVIATNVLGGCMGSTGPASEGPDGRPWGVNFPSLTIADMVRAQTRLMEALGIHRIFAVIGGSMGGMQALEWARQWKGRVDTVIPIASAARQSAQNIGFYEVGRQAIMADPEWCDGGYLERDTRPDRGLGVARMAAHITYVSEEALKQKFDRRLQDRQGFTFGFDADFQIESYLRYQGASFVDRFRRKLLPLHHPRHGLFRPGG